MRIAVAHDYVTQRGGAERVALTLAQRLGQHRLSTLVYEPDGSFPEFAQLAVTTSWLNHVPPFRRDPRLALPLLTRAIERLNVDESDLVLASSSGWAHGITSTVPKVVYCYNPPRWLYQRDEYLRGSGLVARKAIARLSDRLMHWDRDAAASANGYIAISSVVAERIKTAYGIVAPVVPPPLSLKADGPFEPVPSVRGDFFLTVARPRGYKRVSVLTDAFARGGLGTLVVVGSHIQAPQVIGVGRVSDARMRWLYAHCQALVTVSNEDFGLTPLEANVFGRPALALREGGFLDTIREGVNGAFIESPTVDAVQAAVMGLGSYSPETIRGHASTYSEENFLSRIRRVLAPFVST